MRVRFHRVLLDAPCSGTGIIRRHPEIRWRRSAADIERFARLQTEALLAAGDLMAPGGRLVYAVCSLEPEEGPDRVAALLKARGDLALMDARSLLSGTSLRLVDENGFLRTLPHRDDLDGFFAAVIVRRPGS
jgi:16S rRNA (cytosine967-C5)-methyltransferase